MKVVIIGDIGWRYLYHLGDEAMTEAAIDMLRERGIDDITLIAAQPEVATEFYGLPAVTRVGFSGRWSRDGNDGHLTKAMTALQDGDFDEATAFAAIRDCDAVIIAGGGNMNAAHSHHLYERLAITRAAAHFHKPLYVTSQTVGPVLTEADTAKVAEIATYATCFGAREASTRSLVASLTDDPTRIVHTLDDAAVLTADDQSRARIASFDLPERYVAASFSNGHGSTWPRADAYYRAMARVCDELADRCDVDVVLAPHAGSFDTTYATRDQDSNQAIQRHSTSGRVTELPLLTAREDVALIEGAVLSLSTRYHPAVFAPAVGIPSACIAPSYYSSVRMRGALANVGLQPWVITTESMHVAVDSFAEMIERADAVRTHLATSRATTVAYQHQWWDAIVESIKGNGWSHPGNLPTVPLLAPHGEWSTINESTYDLYDRYTRQMEITAMWQEQAEWLAERQSDWEELRDEARAARRYRRRRSVRFADWLGRTTNTTAR